MAEPDISLDIEELLNNPHASIRIKHYQRSGRFTEWRSWIQEDFQISLASNYSAPFEDMLESATQRIGQGDIITQGGFTEFFEENFNLNIESGRTPQAFTYTWSSSERPSFSVPMVFVTTSIDNNPQGNPQAAAARLAALCLPGLEDATFTRPGGYTPGPKGSGADRSPGGTFSLEIGTWFRAPGLVLLSADMTVSQQRMSNGWPLYAEVTANFEPYRLISEEEFLNFFTVSGV